MKYLFVYRFLLEIEAEGTDGCPEHLELSFGRSAGCLRDVLAHRSAVELNSDEKGHGTVDCDRGYIWI